MMKKYLLIPYITSGFPTKKLFLPILKTLSENGADFIEVGVPHSDPLADGPAIQDSSKIALENGVTLNWIVETCRGMSLQKIKPLILFSYFNPILKYGLEKLLKDLPKPLFYGLIIPDLPHEEAEKYLSLFKKYKLNFIPLVAPTTKKEKIKKIVGAYRGTPGGFIYLVSVIGTTGVRKKLSGDLRQKIKEIKSITKKSVGAYCPPEVDPPLADNTPLLVGFGISNAKQAKEVISYGADGVVIGSAIIKILCMGRPVCLPKLKRFIGSFKH